MYEDLKGLVTISQSIGNSVDMVQGGGGNTSAKLENGMMAIKASGYLIKQITEEEGFVAVNYEKIMDYYRNSDHTRDIDFDKESKEVVEATIQQLKSEPRRRPSVEVGFHSALKKYVIHSHSVYANFMCCSANGRDMIDKVMAETGLDYFVLPFINPGYPLSLEIVKVVDERKQQGLNTDVIFLLNHGVIVTSDDADDCVAKNNLISDTIKKMYDMEQFPATGIKQVAEGVFASDTAWLKETLVAYKDIPAMLAEFPLYPDQLVYANGISFEDKSAKIYIDLNSGEITYNGTQSEAQAIEETIVGVVYVLKSNIDKGLEINAMPEEGIKFIAGWESEKYRRTLVNK